VSRPEESAGCNVSLYAVGASACAGSQQAETKKGHVQPYTVIVAVGAPAVVAEEELTVSALAIKDDRCPVEVRCVWAGHAEVRLQASKSGTAAEVTVGTPAPASMNLPSEATYGSYRFTLLSLEPVKSLSNPVAQSAYRATIQISKP
jgi:hypothetical protein